MRSDPLAIPGAMLIEPALYADARGAFFEAWNERVYAAAGIDARFVQENVSVSRRLVLRGLHYQVSQVQGKLIRVLAGSTFDVIVDLRPSSPTRRRWLAVELTSESGRALFVPSGLAHEIYLLNEGGEPSVSLAGCAAVGAYLHREVDGVRLSGGQLEHLRTAAAE